MKIVFFSDTHLYRLNREIKQLTSKKVIANLNGLLHRSSIHNETLAYKFIEKLSDLCPDHLVFSGDFTTSAHAGEYFMASEFLKSLSRVKAPLYAIPGNHDIYTSADKRDQVFYRYLSHHLDYRGDTPFGWCLDHDGIASYTLNRDWELIVIDCAKPNPLFRSGGRFSVDLEHRLQELLAALPEEKKVILTCHFPVISDEKSYRLLQRRDALRELIEKDTKIKLFVNGHTHRGGLQTSHEREDLLFLDAGSVTHHQQGCFFLVEFDHEGLKDIFSYELLPEYDLGQQEIWERVEHV